jgi:ribosomal-protein-alanine N-acetyltransferase
MSDAEIVTPRLRLRRWMPEDRAPFAALNADPRVMEHFPKCLDRTESDAMVDRIEAHFARHGFGPWAVEVKDGAPFIGYIGLAVPRFDAHFMPAVEIGWRLAFHAWGKGYATEGARAVLTFARDELRLSEIVSYTAPSNRRSIRVMENIGLQRNERDDFDHPLVPEGHPLRRHVLYRTAPPSPARDTSAAR